jgi:sugar lactone lactonase YvrE
MTRPHPQPAAFARGRIRSRALPCVLTALLLIGFSTWTAASGPTFWTTATVADFLKGTSDGAYVNLTGTLTPGPDLTSRLTSTPAQVWSLALASDGTIWAGTGGDGRVVRLRQGQPEQTIFDAPEPNVFALAISGATTYAATSPDGRVYAIDAAGNARPFFDPEEKYIWALAVDATGRLWVGAGNPAAIYRVDPSGTGTLVYKPPAAHVISLGIDGNGRLLAGTESPGRLYRFDASDRPFVLLDSGLAELRAIATDPGGVVYAAAVAKGDETPSDNEPVSLAATTAPAPAPATAATTSTASSAASTGTTTTPAPRRSALFRIDPTGTWEEIWSTGDLIYDIAVDPEGVLAATGPAGRLYRVDGTRDVSLLTGVDARQITRFASAPRARTLAAFATANPGRVISVGPGREAQASYTSAVRDTRSVATWGLIRWEGQGPVTLFTRSGNTEKPDDTWSEWSNAYTRATGEMIASPPARFIQWKATLGDRTAASPQLTAVTLAYLPRNARPVVSSITAYPPGVVFQRPFASDDTAIAGLDESVAEARRPAGDTPVAPPTPTRRMFQRGLQTITWKADDDDSDRLVYTLEYRREGEQAWRELKSDLTDTIFVWDTTAVADGRYVVRVRASDSPSNAADHALSGDRESEFIDVDNTPPTLTTELTRQGSNARLLVRVHDARSPILKVEYSVGGGPWQLLYPADGLADSPDETYTIDLANDSDGARVVIRATDVLQNVMSQPASR